MTSWGLCIVIQSPLVFVMDQLDIFEFCLMVEDSFVMDSWQPPLCRRYKKEFQLITYYDWGIMEVENRVAEWLYPRKSAPTEEYIWIIDRIKKKFEKYSRFNKKTSMIFDQAFLAAEDILDLLKSL